LQHLREKLVQRNKYRSLYSGSQVYAISPSKAQLAS
jgi:hypothetical protein